ncbi:hypothetical protein PCANC_17959 [Puccinia coronata f. sp. avenae]|uniref:Uncharacterized protein n=1 Tax=Puccinia coronata f. sp. avenae TaxID=200324 RepID=A0A2N5UR40_9BASI|nr:hypothetical protein PCANC_17959 [Puccinia coronata f. sp. avenae]
MQTGVCRNSSYRLVKPASLTGHTRRTNRPTSEHVGQLLRKDDLLDMSAQLVQTGRTSTSDIWSARAVRLAGPTTCRTAPLNLETSWAVRQVVKPGCSRTH